MYQRLLRRDGSKVPTTSCFSDTSSEVPDLIPSAASDTRCHRRFRSASSTLRAATLSRSPSRDQTNSTLSNPIAANLRFACPHRALSASSSPVSAISTSSSNRKRNVASGPTAGYADSSAVTISAFMLRLFRSAVAWMRAFRSGGIRKPNGAISRVNDASGRFIASHCSKKRLTAIITRCSNITRCVYRRTA